MKVKSGFSAYAKKTIPLKHSPIGVCTRRPGESIIGLGKMLPHGFRVGERIYYVSRGYNTVSNRVYGTVVEYQSDGPFPNINQPDFVWANWARDSGLTSLGSMPKSTVFRA